VSHYGDSVCERIDHRMRDTLWGERRWVITRVRGRTWRSVDNQIWGRILNRVYSSLVELT